MSKLARLLDGLPMLADNSSIVKFTIFSTANYRPFIRQCLGNTLIHLGHSTVGCVLRHRRQVTSSGRATGRISRTRHHNKSRAKKYGHDRGIRKSLVREYSFYTQALSWHKFAIIHYRITIGVYLYMLIKNLLIELINYNMTSSSSSASSSSSSSSSSSLSSSSSNVNLTDFRYLDCLLMGRFRFVGRTNKISTEIANIFLIAFLVFRVIVHTTVPKFKFDVLEFLMNGYTEVLKQQFKRENDNNNHDNWLSVCGGRSQFYQRIQTASDSSRQVSASSKFGQMFDGGGGGGYWRRQTSGRKGKREILVNSIYYLKSFIELQESRWILRPNRTGKSWVILNLCSKFLVYWSIVVLFGWILLIHYAIAGSILTNTGFELSYPSCVAWLRDIQSSTYYSNNYSHIYLAPKVLAYEMPIDDTPARLPVDRNDLPHANLYNFARITADMIENYLLYLEYILMFIGLFYLLAITSIDVILNANAIQERLVSVLRRLEGQKQIELRREIMTEYYEKFIDAYREESMSGFLLELAASRPGELDQQRYELQAAAADASNDGYPFVCNRTKPAIDHEHEPKNNDPGLGEDLSLEIADLQAILADHFDTITRGYNLFVSFFFNIILFIWVLYTIVICTWIATVKSRAIEWEFLMVEIGGTVFALCLLAGSASVRAKNIQLYPLITQAMALDSVTMTTKTRWTIIMKYFHPKPYYCFTILGSTELSMLLCLKLISWILSAFVLLANFYYMKRF